MRAEIRSDEIYEALFDDDALARLPDILTRAANARSAMLNWRHRDGFSEVMAYNYFTPEIMETYARQWATDDPWLTAAIRPERANRIVLCDRYVPAAIFEKSAMYNEFIRGEDDDTFHCAGAVVTSNWGQGLMSVNRGRSESGFDKDDARRLGKVVTHIERVLRARGEIAAAARAERLASSVLDTIGLAAITVRLDGKILHSNHAAEIVMERKDGLLNIQNFLKSTTHQASLDLSAAIGIATLASSRQAETVVVERGPDDPAYLITVTPLAGRSGPAAALLLFRDPMARDGSLTARLRSFFGLTSGEAAIASGLARGLALVEIARARGVKTATVKSQLKSLSLKTGCHSQTEIAALVAGLPPLKS